jgi:thiol-disulfide isomerase/thioredoxin
MNSRRPCALVFLQLLILVGFQLSVQAHPALFSKMPFFEAKALAKKEGKLLVVDFMATWCGPCNHMDETTWVDPAVKDWIAKNAIALQLDVDQDTKISSMMRVSAMPTIVVFGPKNDAMELDRQVGYRDAQSMLDWLNAAKEGKALIQALRDNVAAADGTGSAKEIDARLKLCRQLIGTEDFPAATDQCVWLLTHRDEAGTARNLSQYVTLLSAAYPPAKQRFAEIRDQAEKTDRASWLSLNEALREEKKSLDWFDQVKAANSEVAPWHGTESKLENALIDNGRWQDLAILYKDPLSSLRTNYEQDQQIKKTLTGDPFPYQAAKKYAAFLAAGNDELAEKIATESLRLDDTLAMRQALVNCAMSAHQPRPCHLLWFFEGLDWSGKAASLIIGFGAVVIAGGAISAGIRALIDRNSK